MASRFSFRHNGFDWQFINWYFHHFLRTKPLMQADSKKVNMPDSRWSNMPNRESLDRLFQTRGIDLVWGPAHHSLTPSGLNSSSR